MPAPPDRHARVLLCGSQSSSGRRSPVGVVGEPRNDHDVVATLAQMLCDAGQVGAAPRCFGPEVRGRDEHVQAAHLLRSRLSSTPRTGQRRDPHPHPATTLEAG